jgi:uncharacterized protein HemX
MTPDAVDAATRIAASSQPALVLAIVMLLAVMGVVFALWRLVQRNNEEVKARLVAAEQKNENCERKNDDCLRAHAACEQGMKESKAQNLALAQAIVDGNDGRKHEARARAQTILDLHKPT